MSEYTEAEFAGKVDWEGGIWGALEYGLREDVLPDGELKNEWRKVRLAYESIDTQKIYDLFDAAFEAEEGRT